MSIHRTCSSPVVTEASNTPLAAQPYRDHPTAIPTRCGASVRAPSNARSVLHELNNNESIRGICQNNRRLPEQPKIEYLTTEERSSGTTI